MYDTMDVSALLALSNSTNMTQLGETASTLSCIPVCAQMGFEHIVVALWTLLGLIFTGISTVSVAYFKWQKSLAELKMKQHEELLKIKLDTLEVQKSMSPKVSNNTPPSAAVEAHYLRMQRLLTMFAVVGQDAPSAEPYSQTH